MNKPYTYLIRDPKNDTPIYVGKGTGKRAWDHFRPSCDTHIGRTVKKRIAEGYTVEPIINYEVDDQTALQMEMFWIDFFGRADLGNGTLLNKSNGGDGPAGAIRTPEMRKRLSEVNKGKPGTFNGREHSDETKQKISEKNKGYVASEETRAKLSAAGKGRPAWNKGISHSEETRAKISEGSIHKGQPAWNRGTKHTAETKARMSEAHKNRPPCSDETRAKISAARLGRKYPRR